MLVGRICSSVFANSICDMSESSCRKLAYECLMLAGFAADDQFREHYQKLAKMGLSLALAKVETGRKPQPKSCPPTAAATTVAQL